VTDEELVAGFEKAALGEGEFPHAAHVRVAWWYLRRHPLPEALGRFCNGLRRFAAAKGVPQRYHETMTVAYMLLIAERMDDGRDLPWPRFAERNGDLLVRSPSILDRYYTEAMLASARARRSFVMPDRIAVAHQPELTGAGGPTEASVSSGG
jgi:hypothetical protein